MCSENPLIVAASHQIAGWVLFLVYEGFHNLSESVPLELQKLRVIYTAGAVEILRLVVF